MPISVSSTDSDAKTANFKPYLLRDGLRFQSKSKRKLSSDAWKGEESPTLRNLNTPSLTTDKMAKKVKKGHFKNFAAQPMLRETRPFFIFQPCRSSDSSSKTISSSKTCERRGPNGPPQRTRTYLYPLKYSSVRSNGKFANITQFQMRSSLKYLEILTQF